MIHPSAIVDPAAQLASDVSVGPFTVIGPDVKIGSGTRVASHAVIKGPTSIGANCEIFQFATVGEATPDLKYQGEATTLTIGDRNVIREGVTLHRGTVQDRGDTLIGDDNLLMAYAHVGHDCVIGNHCIFVNNAVLAGHVEVDDWSIVGGYAGVHQYCKLGAHCFVGGMSKVTQDVPAYVIAEGHPASPRMINAEGLKRRGFSREDISLLQRGYKTLYRKKLPLKDALQALQELAPGNDAMAVLLQSIERSERGIIR
ncbi:MAG: acyl-ACP--UDP-N-acetylglucosamine O-acyltransferase [Gammaproteobacteria bacterium]|nr:acyl-ACP--UDP-N-acetylglucosamine O-acyltransferase [Gammaproteobacteria bacterium]NND39474.1 acyl-ACP--UDP-N-acetylglucosamine O-acyltransferase [Pseudomonadales bacterium]NNL10366.1 acyl-ACP--UDP-N-acetylglucosamine O-acyltransferase [Pseudomonadales bacterium]RZV54346.1 MAG: acyl-ACP--UDP-N-acetylglucosamine O-acyltransferase [Pseudomonadales bacterium]